MAGTPNADRMEAYILSIDCGHCGQPMAELVRFGRYNKRPIRGSDPPRWSQHAAYEIRDGENYRHNALDIHQKDGALAPNAPHLAWLAGHLLGIKGSYDEFGMGLYHILWDGRSLTTGNPVSGHRNHIHVDFVGSFACRYPDHPTDGDPLRVRNRGLLSPPKITNHFVLYPWEGGEIPIPPITDPEEDEVEQVYKDLQTGLQAAGYYDGVIDGIWGPKSKAAYEAMCKDAAKAGLSHAHPFTGMTEGPQV